MSLINGNGPTQVTEKQVTEKTHTYIVTEAFGGSHRKRMKSGLRGPSQMNLKT